MKWYIHVAAVLVGMMIGFLLAAGLWVCAQLLRLALLGVL